MLFPPQPGQAPFHRERSLLLDAFVDCEVEVNGILKKGGAKPGGEILGQRIAKLIAVPASSTYAKSHKARVDALLAELLELACVRADIVHARLDIVNVDGVACARFRNVRNAADPYAPVRLITLADLRALTRRVAQIAEDLREPAKPVPVSPASSPPQPLPA